MSNTAYEDRVRHLIVVFGDQLNLDSSAFDGFDRDHDAVLMMEVVEEATYVPQHKQRLTLFFAAMRHFRDELTAEGARVHYTTLDDRNNRGTFNDELTRWVHKTRPDKLIACQPGDYRVLQMLRDTAGSLDCCLDVREDRHFYCDHETFASHARGRKELLMENFYRQMRREHRVLIDNGKPVGGDWNFDKQNRESFGARGPGDIKRPTAFRPDDVTQQVMKTVERRFGGSPGALDHFHYPVTRDEAKRALKDFIEHRLPSFGTYQDAMVRGEPFLFHSRLSAAINLHLLSPREAVDAAAHAYQAGDAPINAVEGFVRQILGWREYVRGIYWHFMPNFAEMNSLQAQQPKPAFMWTAETDMACVSESVGQLIEHGYAHHIQRLMVLGLYAMLLGVRPYDVHRWHMSMYVDAIDWVSLPNVLGMSQYGDGGLVGTKPYAASGNYINKMSDYCKGCRFDPKKAIGDEACPFTSLYWDFLQRHRTRFANNRRMGFQLKNLERKSNAELRDIGRAAQKHRDAATAKTYL